MFKRHFVFRTQTPADGEIIKVHPETSDIDIMHSEEVGNIVCWVEPTKGITPGDILGVIGTMSRIFVLSIVAGAGFIIGVSLLGVL